MVSQNTLVSKLKRFQHLTKIVFSDNNLHSFIQLSKFECLPSLTSLVIENNDVNHTVLCRSFIVYRFPSLTEVNNIKVTENDKTKAREQFHLFDKILCSPSLLVRIIQKINHEHEDKEAQKQYRINAKNHAAFSVNYVQKIVSFSLGVVNKIEILTKSWDKVLDDTIKSCTLELSVPKCITDDSIANLAKKF